MGSGMVKKEEIKKGNEGRGERGKEKNEQLERERKPRR